MRDLIIQKVREAEELASHSTAGSATQQGWLRVANSFRLIAERLLSERPGEDDPTILVLH